jgi:hypothetical protein
MARQWMNKRRAQRATLAVLALQGAMLLTWWVTPAWDPPRLRLLQLLWAAAHRPSFYPLAALVVAGPLLTLLAWQRKGSHRHYLLAGWAVFLLVTFGFFARRALNMLDVLWWSIRS